MKQILAILFTLLFCFALSAQNTDSVSFMNDLAMKKTATIGDAVRLFLLATGKAPSNFTADAKSLTDAGLLPDRVLKEEDVLKRGLLAKMIAKHLQLNDSLFFNIFKSERYAFTACVAANLMVPEGSEYDKISGSELVEIMTKVADRTGGGE